MKITAHRQPQPAPPITGYTLELTPREMHDLRVIAGIDEAVMRNALKSSQGPRVSNGVQTHNVYDLLEDLRGIE